jgi:hypothetical protein
MDPHFVLDVRAEVPDTVHFDDLGDRLRLAAKEPMRGFGSGRFHEPTVYVDIDLDALDSDIKILGYAFTQFAMPLVGSRTRPFDFSPAPNLFSPPALMPVILQNRDGMCCLLAPLDSWHEQIFAIVQDDDGVHGLRWGWHGDLDEVDEEFDTTIGIYRGPSAAALMDQWGRDVRAARNTSRLDRYADPIVSHLSYWTDNGAAYWYRTEAGLDLSTTLENKLAELRKLQVPVKAVELDSWFYRHEVTRPVSEIGYLSEVPPTGMLEWVGRDDVLPDGVAGLATRLGNPPLTLHSRHISTQSPYLDDGEWWVDKAAHPVDQQFFRRWFDDAVSWGATCIQQDWMMPAWFRVRQLREVPGRAMAWQRGLDELAAEADMTLMWCMATPGDFMATVELDRIIAVRTSDDYRFAADPALLWHWYLTVNRLAAALGLVTSKDCFFTMGLDGATDAIDGDPYPEVEALLSAMSAGVVAIGDRIGRTDVSIVDRLCRPDGLLMKPDAPIATADQSLFRDWSSNDGLLWATARSGRWHYVVALHAGSDDSVIRDRFVLSTLGGDAEYLVYNWRSGKASPAATIDIELAHRDWALFVCCPIEDRGGRRRALIGDPTKYVTMADKRVAYDGDTAAGLAADGEPHVPLRWWIEGEGALDR